MKHQVTIENAETGVQQVLEIELTPGDSLVEEASKRVSSYAWNLLDVVVMDEVDDPIPFDPRFPSRPTHPDFTRLSSAVAMQDAVSDMLGVEAASSADLPSLIYMARGRVDALVGRSGGALTIETLLALYMDGFQLGIGFTERGGHRPNETGNTGEKEGSL